jgi:hypothetical protein
MRIDQDAIVHMKNLSMPKSALGYYVSMIYKIFCFSQPISIGVDNMSFNFPKSYGNLIN